MSQSFWHHMDFTQVFQACPYVLSLLGHLILSSLFRSSALAVPCPYQASGSYFWRCCSLHSSSSSELFVCSLCVCPVFCVSFFPSLPLKISLPSPSQLAGSHMTAVDSYGWPKPNPVYFLIWAHIPDCLGVSLCHHIHLNFPFHWDTGPTLCIQGKLIAPQVMAAGSGGAVGAAAPEREIFLKIY